MNMQIRVVCGWCPPDARTVIVDVPGTPDGISHGICDACLEKMRAQMARHEAGATLKK